MADTQAGQHTKYNHLDKVQQTWFERRPRLIGGLHGLPISLAVFGRGRASHIYHYPYMDRLITSWPSATRNLEPGILQYVMQDCQFVQFHSVTSVFSNIWLNCERYQFLMHYLAVKENFYMFGFYNKILSGKPITYTGIIFWVFIVCPIQLNIHCGPSILRPPMGPKKCGLI